MYVNKLLIFDLDDTLIDTSNVYWEAKNAFINVISNNTNNISKTSIGDLFETIDTRNLSSMGHSPIRYKKSMIDTYQLLSTDGYFTQNTAIEKEINDAGNIIINTIPKLIDGALELLKWCKTNYTLALITRGEKEFQLKKINYHSLSKYFEMIDIVSKKDQFHFIEVINSLKFDKKNTWIIGDSLKSEIETGLQMGLNCIFYNYTHPSYHWIQERNYSLTSSKSFFKVNKLNEIPSILINNK